MLEPIKVIIQDFPKFLSEYFNLDLFAIKTDIRAKMQLTVYNAVVKPFALKFHINNSDLITQINAKFEVKMTMVNTILTKMRQKATSNTKLSIKFSANDKKVKLLQRATGALSLGMKSYLQPNGYVIGTALKLGYWDGLPDSPNGYTKLSDMDNIDMYDIAILKSDE